MRAALCLASIGLALMTVAATPAAAFDDTLPRWAPYRAHHHHHHYYAHHHCHRLFWRDRCGPYRLGGYFVRNQDFRRARVFRHR